jgi:hypothetical protein
MIGRRRGEAADFLISLLAGKEMPTVEVIRLAEEKGITGSTLVRAKRTVGAKARKKGNCWFVSVSADMKGRIFSVPKPSQQDFLLKSVKSCIISEDWVSVTQNSEGCTKEHKIDIPACVPSSGGLRIKIGAYEFEADENFPADKLAEILRGLVANAGVFDQLVQPGLIGDCV